MYRPVIVTHTVSILYGVAEIVMDNGLAFVAAAAYLSEKYGIHHIKISPYNSQANGLVEHKHFNICESLMKACDNDDSRWVRLAPSVFWADCVTICWSTGYSPFFMAHSVEAVLPFDIVEATYLLLPLDTPTSTEDLITHCAQQLLKRPEDLHDMGHWVLKACKLSAAQFVSHFASTIVDYDLLVGSLVLMQNSHVKRSLTARIRPANWD